MHGTCIEKGTIAGLKPPRSIHISSLTHIPACRLQEVLPAWAKVRVVDTSKALHTQVTQPPNSMFCYVSICTAPFVRSKLLIIQLSSAGICSVAFQVAFQVVLVPSTGHVPAEAINTATDLRFIVNHGAGRDG